jgi:hypothetical protein
MNAKRGASLLVALTAVMVGQLFVSLTAAQSASSAPQHGAQVPGTLASPIPGQVQPGGQPHRGPITPADPARRASRRDLIPRLPAASSTSGSPIFFAAPTYGSDGFNPESVTMADVNGDGTPDLVVANVCGSDDCSGGGVSVLLGNGDGTFQTAVSYGSGGLFTAAVVVADVNGDGKSDLVVANQYADNTYTIGSISVLLGNGDGTFQAAISYGSGAWDAYSVAVGDMNGDGKPDLVVANLCVDVNCANGTVAVLLGNGDGTFQTAVSYGSGGYNALSVAVGDLNGDGKLDVVVENIDAVSVLLGLGNGTLESAVRYPSGGGNGIPASLALGDVNGDGKPDIVVTDNAGDYGQDGEVGVLLGNGDGTFKAAVGYDSGGGNAVFVAVADVNGDGKPDLVVANQCLVGYLDGYCEVQANSSVGVLLGNGDGTFQSPMSYWSGGSSATSVAVSDVNGDGKPDLLVANQDEFDGSQGGSVSVLLGNGDGTFQSAPSYSSGALEFEIPAAAAVGDFNGDGKQDVVVANGGVGVLLGNGDGTFQPALSYGSGGWDDEDYSVAVGDVNGDGKLDIVVSNACTAYPCGNGSAGVLLGNGDGTFQTALTYESGGPDTYSVALADVNGDGKLDLVLENYCATNSNCTNGTISVLLGNGDGTFQAAVNYGSGGGFPYSFAVGDVNGDGKLDLIVANVCAVGPCVNPTDTGTVGVLLGNGDGTFQVAVSYGSGGISAISVSIGDINGDGKPDLVVVNTSCAGTNCPADGSSVSVLLGNGDGTFQTATSTTTPPMFGGPGSYLTLADFNGDGKLDVAFAGGDVLLLGNGDGTFQTPITLGAFGNGIAVGDFNSDGKPDLAVAGIGSVTILSNIAANFHYATTTAVTSSLNPAPAGQPVTFTASVTPAFNVGALSGSVTFYDGTTTLGVATLSGGTATFPTAALTIGVHSITAAYSGDSNYLPSTSPALLETINASTSPTTTTLASSLNPSSYNQTVSFTASVSSASGTPTGTVTFTDGATQLGTATLAGGIATSSSSSLAVGSHTITASYGGNSNFTSSSATITQTVNQATSSIVLTSSGSPTVYGQNVTLTASIAPQNGGVCTGSVTFSDGGTTLATVNAVGNSASFSTTSLAAGTHSITATYSGDSNFSRSTSSPIAQVVNPAATTVALTSSRNPSYLGQPVTFSATVTGQNGGAVSGTVAFKQGGTTLATVTLLNGQAAYTTTSLTAGTHAITAVYSGDSNDLPSTSAVVDQVVDSLPAATTTQLVTSGSASFIGQTVTFTATITSAYGPIPNGETVTFYDGASAIGTGLTTGGVATFQTASLSVKTHTIKATYSGDANLKSSSGRVTQAVSLYASTTTVTSSPNPSSYGQTIELTATVTSGVPGGLIGTVTFKNGATTLGTGTLSGDTATLSTTKLAVGSFTITATYSGDTQVGPSSGTVTQTVNQAMTTTAVSSSVNPSGAGQKVKFTATVTSLTTSPTGTVTFMDGSTTLGTGTLAGGKTSFSTSTLSAGPHNITAVYNGTANIEGSTSAVLVQTVN